jgi:hypothetical protein
MWLHEYERLLHDAAPNAFDAAVALKARHRPRSLFKYRGATELALESLRDGYVWLSQPQFFNDGYDSAILVDHARLLAMTMRRSVRSLIAEHELATSLSEADIRSVESSEDPARTLGALLLKQDPSLAHIDPNRVLDALAAAVYKQSEDYEKAAREIARCSILVCSFATTGTAPVLWANYADNNTGFCIEYDLEQIPPGDIRLRLLFPVIYGSAPMDATRLFEDFLVNGLNPMTVRWPILAATYKHLDWSFEREWRLVDPAGHRINGRKVTMPIKAAYLGSAISSAATAKVMDAAKHHGIQVFRMQVGKDAAALSPVPAS